MGCGSSKSVNDGIIIKPKKKKKFFKGKKPKDYASDPKFQAFIACDAQGDMNEPKSMYILKDKVPAALEAINI